MGVRVVLCCCLLTVLLSLVDCTRIVSARLELPPVVTIRLTPLTGLQTATYLGYIKHGELSQHTDEFCKAGHLFCGGSSDDHAAKWLSNKPDPEDYANIEEVIFAQWVDDECVDDLPDQQRAAAFLHETVELWRAQHHSVQASNYLQSEKTLTYFRESNLAVGRRVVVPKYLYGDVKPRTAFLPELLANRFPLLATQFPDLLRAFKIAPDSRIASHMATIVDYCSRLDRRPQKQDAVVVSSCATSVEAMLRFVSSIMHGKHMQALTNSKMVGTPGKPVKLLQKVETQGVGGAVVDCHDMVFPFVMYGCHSIKQSKALQVTLQAEDGNTMQLLVACHMNTSTFNPAHEAFALLHSSPGKTEICHWLPSKDILWLPA